MIYELDELNAIRESFDIPPGMFAVALDAYASEVFERSNIDRAFVIHKYFNYTLEHDLLLGEMDWEHYSADGCSLVYREDVAKRFGLNISTDGEVIGNRLVTMQVAALERTPVYILDKEMRRVARVYTNYA